MSEKTTGFEVSKKIVKSQNTIIIFTFKSKFSDTEFLEFLALFDKFLTNYKDLKKSFAVLIDTTQCTSVPLRSSISLLKWMRSRSEEIPGTLLCSAVVVKSSLISSLITQALKIQPTKAPNMMTVSYEKAYEFCMEHLK